MPPVIEVFGVCSGGTGIGAKEDDANRNTSEIVAQAKTAPQGDRAVQRIGADFGGRQNDLPVDDIVIG